jgi:hypothetical protein
VKKKKKTRLHPRLYPLGPHLVKKKAASSGFLPDLGREKKFLRGSGLYPFDPSLIRIIEPKSLQVIEKIGIFRLRDGIQLSLLKKGLVLQGYSRIRQGIKSRLGPGSSIGCIHM